jgi:putative hydrolase of the HAD superfamily
VRTDADRRLTLIFDADDTLWENNIYFERAIAEFVTLVNHSSLTPPEVREVLDRIERTTIGVKGYGAESFAHSLAETFRELAEGDVTNEDVARVEALGLRILTQEKELLTGVESTLAQLSRRHSMAILTKGNLEEQQLKVERSGLVPYFTHADVVAEKDVETYHRLARSHGWNPATTWMIGNSPKSDINPALAAGLNAVYIPHSATWSLEHQDLEEPDDPARLMTLHRFADLLLHF